MFLPVTNYPRTKLSHAEIYALCPMLSDREKTPENLLL